MDRGDGNDFFNDILRESLTNDHDELLDDEIHSESNHKLVDNVYPVPEETVTLDDNQDSTEKLVHDVFKGRGDDSIKAQNHMQRTYNVTYTPKIGHDTKVTRYERTPRLNTHKRLFGSINHAPRTSHEENLKTFNNNKKEEYARCQLARFNRTTPRNSDEFTQPAKEESLHLDPPVPATVRDSVQDILDNMDNFSVPCRPVSRNNYYFGENKKTTESLVTDAVAEPTPTKKKSQLKRPPQLIKFRPSSVQQGLFGRQPAAAHAASEEGHRPLVFDATGNRAGVLRPEMRKKSEKAPQPLRTKPRPTPTRPPSRTGIPSQLHRPSEVEEGLFGRRPAAAEWRAPWDTEAEAKPHVFDATDYRKPRRPRSANTHSKPVWK